MSASLVGSEMCIRDSASPEGPGWRTSWGSTLAPTTGVASKRSRLRVCHMLGELHGEPPNNRPQESPPASRK
eukprot:5644427-Alexandrium_andersonii.AAC.1